LGEFGLAKHTRRTIVIISPASVDVGDIKVRWRSRRSFEIHMTPLGSASGESDAAMNSRSVTPTSEARCPESGNWLQMQNSYQHWLGSFVLGWEDRNNEESTQIYPREGGFRITIPVIGD